MRSYKNPFYSAKYQGSKPAINTDATPIEYKEHYIYERIKGECFDVVKGGICESMRASLNGAKKFIDNKTITLCRAADKEKGLAESPRQKQKRRKTGL